MALSHLVGFDDAPFERGRRNDVPVDGCAVARHAPDLIAIRDALLSRVPGGARQWALVEAAGPMVPGEGVWVQREGPSLEEAADVIRRTAAHGRIPEPLRAAHPVPAGLSG